MIDTSESISQSFIVKVWVEEEAGDTGYGIWHGHITHIPSGERRYLKNLDEIRDFIAPHIENMGVRLGKGWRVRRWLKGLIGQN
jgi:hypothetical protein